MARGRKRVGWPLLPRPAPANSLGWRLKRSSKSGRANATRSRLYPENLSKRVSCATLSLLFASSPLLLFGFWYDLPCPWLDLRFFSLEIKKESASPLSSAVRSPESPGLPISPRAPLVCFLVSSIPFFSPLRRTYSAL